MYDTAAENIEGTYVFYLPSLAFPEMLPRGYHLSYPRARFSPRLTEDQLMENVINMSFSGSMSFSFLRHNFVSTNMPFNLDDKAISHHRNLGSKPSSSHKTRSSVPYFLQQIIGVAASGQNKIAAMTFEPRGGAWGVCSRQKATAPLFLKSERELWMSEQESDFKRAFTLRGGGCCLKDANRPPWKKLDTSCGL